MRALEEAAEAAGIRLKPLDKKAEKAALASQRAALRGQLQCEQDPATALSLVVPLLVIQVNWASAAAAAANLLGGNAHSLCVCCTHPGSLPRMVVSLPAYHGVHRFCAFLSRVECAALL